MNRRQFAVLAGASLVPGAGCSAVEGVVGAPYEESDLELMLEAECASAGGENVVVTLSWEWADGDGGTEPDDLAVIDWPDEQWTLVEPARSTTDTVRFDGPGVVDGREGVRFEHEDAQADGGTTYAASVEISPKDDATADAGRVRGRFAHVRDDGAPSDDTDDWFFDVSQEWTVTSDPDRSGSPCGSGS